MAFAVVHRSRPDLETGKELSDVLQARLHDLNDLHLILKHAHWNVTGPGFIAVHEMIDPRSTPFASSSTLSQSVWQTLAPNPNGLAGAMVAQRPVEDYPVGRARVADHLRPERRVHPRD